MIIELRLSPNQRLTVHPLARRRSFGEGQACSILDSGGDNLSTIRVLFAISGAVILFGTARVYSSIEVADFRSTLCSKAFQQAQPGRSVTTAGILAPNKSLVAWSEATLEPAANIFRTAVIIRDKTTGTSETVFRTQTNQAGQIVGPTGKAFEWANADQFCVIDWSRDSGHLLVREVIGRTEADNRTANVWIYALQAKRRSVIPLSALHRAIVDHWKRKGVNFHGVDYLLDPDGWEDSDRPRPAFIVTVLEGPPTNFPSGFDDFLGVWSVSLSGAEPKLLTENRNLNVVRRYGQVKSEQPSSR